MAYDNAKLSERFKDDGFVIVEGFLNPAEIDKLDNELERINKGIIYLLPQKEVLPAYFPFPFKLFDWRCLLWLLRQCRWFVGSDGFDCSG